MFEHVRDEPDDAWGGVGVGETVVHVASKSGLVSRTTLRPSQEHDPPRENHDPCGAVISHNECESSPSK